MDSGIWSRLASAAAARWIPLWLILLCVATAAADAYEVGHRTLTFVDPSRSNRQIPAEVYYPADVPGEEVPIADPPPLGFPVAVFGHGFVIPVDDYLYVWTGLVPAGYIIALPRTETGLSPNHLDLGLDLAFACSALREAGQDPGSPFFAKVAAASAVGGHSMGGGASFLGLASDASITALFNFAAAETNPSAIEAAAQIDAPALLFAGSLDCVTPPQDHQQPMYQALASDCRTYIELLGASHCQFAEYNFLCEFGEIACADPTISRNEQHSLTLQFLLPWLDAFLLDDPQAWDAFQGLLAEHPGIVFEQDCPAAGIHDELDPADKVPAVELPRLVVPALAPVSDAVPVRFYLPRGAPVDLCVHDPTGRCAGRIASGSFSGGWHDLAWNGRDQMGRDATSGVYFLRLASHDACKPVRLHLVR
jgi:hypothetical protein